MAQPARADDYDSDRSEVRPGTTKIASSNASRRQPSSSRGRERSQTMVPTLAPVISRRSSTPAATQAPQLQRTQSQTRRVQVHAPPLSRSNSISRQAPIMCTNPNCGEPGCTARLQQSMYTRPPPNAMPPPQTVPVTYTPIMQPAYAQPRPRPQSMSGRPVSWYGQPVTSQGYQPHGPPPSPSAYTRAPPRQAVYATPPAPPVMASYGAPLFTQPPAAIDTMMAGMAITRPGSSYSARTLPSEYTMNVRPISRAQPQPLVRTTSLSARRPTLTRTVPGAFPDELAIEDDYIDYEYVKEIREPMSKRDSKLMGPPPRPAIRPVQTTPNFSARSVQDHSPRTSTSDTGVDFMKYETVDPERTPRPTKDRRNSSSSTSYAPRVDYERNPRSATRHSHTNSSSRSRRQSASTASSSEHTRSTNISTAPSDQLANAMAYQKHMRGEEPAELTAENIREVDFQRTRSRTSGRSHKSGHSASNPDGVRIMLGGSMIQLDGDTPFSYHPEADGKLPQVIITKGGSRSTAESRSTSSRIGRSRGGSERGSISREQPIFEGRES